MSLMTVPHCAHYIINLINLSPIRVNIIDKSEYLHV